jgi:hypothetical protein
MPSEQKSASRRLAADERIGTNVARDAHSVAVDVPHHAVCLLHSSRRVLLGKFRIDRNVLRTSNRELKRVEVSRLAPEKFYLGRSMLYHDDVHLWKSKEKPA